MSDAQFVARAAGPLREIIHRIKPEQLDAPTPCAEFDVRALVNHLLFWGPSLVGAARKESVPPPAEAETELKLSDGEWVTALEAQLDRIVAAWREPEAWQGTTYMGGPTKLPASMVGGMVVGELVVHGWDLARATGQQPTWQEDLLRYLHAEVSKVAEQGREMGVYGPEVAVPASASTLDQLLAVTGRTPGWRSE